MFRESGHVDSIFCDVGNDDEGNVEARMAVKAQDLHDILDVILASYVDVQETGFYWDLSYKNKVYEGIKFVLFTPNLWVDTDEVDKVCGHYSSQGQHVANICQYCTVPTMFADSTTGSWPHKTVDMVYELVEAEDFEGLRKISQQYIQNAFYPLQFGLHNNQGIHGACPLEMLHAILLGMFKYINECFFQQIGPKLQAAKDINALAQIW
jgi:hypothetical protein